jgi:hypothetical protein
MTYVDTVLARQHELAKLILEAAAVYDIQYSVAELKRLVDFAMDSYPDSAVAYLAVINLGKRD